MDTYTFTVLDSSFFNNESVLSDNSLCYSIENTLIKLNDTLSTNNNLFNTLILSENYGGDSSVVERSAVDSNFVASSRTREIWVRFPVIAYLSRRPKW